MITTHHTNKIRENLLYELNNSKPETLEMIYYFVQTLKKSFRPDNSETIFNLASLAGSIDNKNGKEMIKCINNEFNKIEGEW